MTQVQTEIDRLESAKQAIASAIADKGVTVPSGTMLDGMAALIGSIEAPGGGGSVALTLKNYGTFTPASELSVTSSSPLTIEHGCGVTPDVILIYNQAVVGSGKVKHLLAIRMSDGYFAISSANANTASTSKNKTTLTWNEQTFQIKNPITTYNFSTVSYRWEAYANETI